MTHILSKMQNLFVTIIATVAVLSANAQDTAEFREKLQKPITLRIEVEPLSAVCEKLSQATGVRFEAAAAIKHTLIILYAKERPANEIIQKINANFKWEIQQEADTLRFVPTNEYKNEQRNLYNEAILKPYKEIKERAQKNIRELENLNRAVAKQLQKALEEKIDKLYEQMGENETNKELDEMINTLWKENEKLQEQINPAKLLVLKAFLSLSDQKLIELEARGRIVIAYRPTSAQLPMNQNVAKEAEKFIQNLLDDIAEWEQENDPAKYAPQPDEFIATNDEKSAIYYKDFVPTPPHSLKSWTIDDVANVRIIFNEHRRATLSSALYAEVHILDRNGANIVQISAAVDPDQIQRYQYSAAPEDENIEINQQPKTTLDTSALPDFIKKPLEPTALLKEITTLDNQDPTSVKTVFDILAKFLQVGNKIDPVATYGILLCELAESGKFSIVSDAHDMHVSATFGKNIPLTNAAEVLHNLQQTTQQQWNAKEDWVTMRTDYWPYQEAFNVPRETYFNFRDLYVKQAGLSIDQIAALAHALTDKQLQSQCLAVMMMNAITLNDPTLAYVYRMYHTLTPLQKQNLLENQTLRVGDISPIAASFLAEFLYRTGELQENDRSYDPFDFTWLDTMGKEPESKYKNWKEEYEDRMIDREVTQIIPNGPTPATIIKSNNQSGNSLSMLMSFAGTPGLATTMNLRMVAYFLVSKEEDGGGMDVLPVNVKETYRPATQQKLKLTFEISPHHVTSAFLHGGFSDPNGKFVPLESLPPHILKELEDLIQKTKQRMQDWGRYRTDPPPHS